MREIGNGNLDYRIVYDRADEFQPVCLAFNEMAQWLKFSVEQTRKNEESRERRKRRTQCDYYIADCKGLRWKRF